MGDIIFIVHRVPFPPDRGDKIRSFHILKALAKLAPVHLATFADDAADMAHDATLAQWTKTRCIVPRAVSKPKAALSALLGNKPLSVTLFDDPTLHAYIAQALRDHLVSAIVVFSGQMAHFVPTDFAGRFVMDFVDVDSAKFASYAESGGLHPMRLIHAREASLLARFEAQTARRADVSLLVSAAEAALFRTRAHLDSSRIRALENGIDTMFFDPAAQFETLPDTTEGPLIAFTGQMDYRPNIDAVNWFARQVMPLVRQTHATARFAIVGRAPTRDVLALDGLNGTMVTGAVDDVRTWLAAADVIAAPLLLARGIQNKVLEAMAMARPVVASPAAAEGIDAAPGRELLVAQDAPAMAAHITNLLNDPVAAAAMGHAARARMIARYGWDACLADLAELVAPSPPVAKRDLAA